MELRGLAPIGSVSCICIRLCVCLCTCRVLMTDTCEERDKVKAMCVLPQVDMLAVSWLAQEAGTALGRSAWPCHAALHPSTTGC